jgi:ankyrin repeat domain-containing protein 50
VVTNVVQFQRFRWVALQLDALQNCRNRDEIAEMLKSLPETLDATYDRILLKINKSDAKYAAKVLQFIAFAARPVTIEEVADVIAMNGDTHHRDQGLEDIMEILDICASLVTLSSSSKSKLI